VYIRDIVGAITTSGFGGRHLVSVVGRCRSLLYIIDLNSATSKHMVYLWNWDSICNGTVIITTSGFGCRHLDSAIISEKLLIIFNTNSDHVNYSRFATVNRLLLNAGEFTYFLVSGWPYWRPSWKISVHFSPRQHVGCLAEDVLGSVRKNQNENPLHLQEIRFFQQAGSFWPGVTMRGLSLFKV